MDEILMQIVVDERGRIIYDDEGRVCLQNNDLSSEMQTSTEDASTSGIGRVDQSSQMQTSIEDASTSGIARVDQSSQMQTSIEDASTSGIARVEDIRAYWSRNDILKLINAYKENQEAFRSNSIKNSEAWRMVAADVPGFSTKQCEAKFKYLKSLYTKKKDNMGNNSSGARAINFEYFDEFDEIFHQEPNITPVAIASSSSIVQMEGHTTPTHEVGANSHRVGSPANHDESSDASSAGPVKKRKRTRLEIQLEKFQQNMELREQARERRMNRFLEQQEICSNRICDMMQKFIDKL